ncbi:uncharacterized protein BDZ83DRAFT_653953 [Colletotrichum acutatum]|uniref:Uncharacterized protein n=1 Tax=Glomerella acutata TaxID=27357 RepID=A0AAD8UIK1_GLOAC|nr:uncharacterized protein BDZ83DRAFT_653953 [Colletotrichum acutatum]KAK1722359.1 hypothetical protein BDZ83DRAFT_653953 [Colletotrichum acutatum]
MTTAKLVMNPEFMSNGSAENDLSAAVGQQSSFNSWFPRPKWRLHLSSDCHIKSCDDCEGDRGVGAIQRAIEFNASQKWTGYWRLYPAQDPLVRESIAFSVGRRRGGAHRNRLAIQRGALVVERLSTMSVTVVDSNSMKVELRREESLYPLRKVVGNGFGDVVAGASEWFG